MNLIAFIFFFLLGCGSQDISENLNSNNIKGCDEILKEGVDYSLSELSIRSQKLAIKSCKQHKCTEENIACVNSINKKSDPCYEQYDKGILNDVEYVDCLKDFEKKSNDSCHEKYQDCLIQIQL